ncbi:hypothetical protein [Polycladidibacter hongkongensis]|uniref:hypothetical protein n=1 Tax=Polycladidibacter hongkongensis TaxID=1647556 RepID=UPI00083643BF|nr:hypothetical protein [Pseudovibrio hongkongensis]
MITPGHATYCAEGEYAGQHVPILDILRSDSVIQRDDGGLVRASTGKEVGSEHDQLVEVVAGKRCEIDGSIEVSERGTLRLDTRFFTADGQNICIADVITAAGAVVTDGGLLKPVSGGDSAPFHWPFGERLPNPEDYVLAASSLSLEEIYDESEWEPAFPPLSPAP